MWDLRMDICTGEICTWRSFLSTPEYSVMQIIVKPSGFNPTPLDYYELFIIKYLSSPPNGHHLEQAPRNESARHEVERRTPWQF